ncbi:MAG: hypothetical protein ACXAEN_14760 [Candidatus Thorarchaeota archaeon]|jgi:hypothetical protein
MAVIIHGGMTLDEAVKEVVRGHSTFDKALVLLATWEHAMTSYESRDPQFHRCFKAFLSAWEKKGEKKNAVSFLPRKFGRRVR